MSYNVRSTAQNTKILDLQCDDVKRRWHVSRHLSNLGGKATKYYNIVQYVYIPDCTLEVFSANQMATPSLYLC